LRRSVQSAAHIGTGFITPWNLLFNKRSYKDGTGKCSIARGGAGVFLAIYEIDLAEKWKLDLAEGLGSGYDEISITVPDYGDCLAYVADEGAIDEALHPVDWYREMVIVGCEFNQFPTYYLQAIKAIESRPDTDDQRSRREWELVEKLRNGT
jgi:hypothetical protein